MIGGTDLVGHLGVMIYIDVHIIYTMLQTQGKYLMLFDGDIGDIIMFDGYPLVN